MFAFSLLQVVVLLRVSPSVIRGDGIGYYAYLRSIAIDGDFDFRNEYEYYASMFPQDAQPMSTDFLDGRTTPNGYVHNPWPIGPALLWSPFFAVAHVGAKLFGLTANGYTTPYQFAVATGSASYGFAAILMLIGLARDWFGESCSLAAGFLVWFATPLTAYMYFIPSMSHACSLFTVALFLTVWHRTRGRRSIPMYFVLGLCAGLMMMQRHQDALFIAVLVVESVADLIAARPDERWTRLRHLVVGTTSFAVGTVIGAFPQLVAWKVMYGSFLVNAQLESTGYSFLYWSSPRLVEVLTAPGYGLFTWTPVVLVGAIGLAPFTRLDRVFGLGLIAAFVLQLYVIASWEWYYQGATFGGRMFVSSSIAFGLGLAAACRWWRARIPAWTGFLIGSALVAWNYILLAQYGLGLFERGTRNLTWSQVVTNVFKLVEVLRSNLG